MNVAFDTTDAVGESIRDVVITLLEAIVLVILVIFVFLQDWRTTFIPADHHSRSRSSARLLSSSCLAFPSTR